MSGNETDALAPKPIPSIQVACMRSRSCSPFSYLTLHYSMSLLLLAPDAQLTETERRTPDCNSAQRKRDVIACTAISATYTGGLLLNSQRNQACNFCGLVPRLMRILGGGAAICVRRPFQNEGGYRTDRKMRKFPWTFRLFVGTSSYAEAADRSRD